MRNRHQIKKEEKERMFLCKNVKIICSILDDNFAGSDVCQEMLCYNKGERGKGDRWCSNVEVLQ